MKIGLAISALFASVIFGLFMLQSRQHPDASTHASSDANLKIQHLPKDLPHISSASSDNQAPDDTFNVLLTNSRKHEHIINGGVETSDKLPKAKLVCDELINAVNAGEFPDSFADKDIQPSQTETEQLKLGLRVLRTSVQVYIGESLRSATYDRPNEVASAYFELGHRLFEQNTRLKPRQHGLAIMKAGISERVRIASAQHEAGVINEGKKQEIISHCKEWLEAITEIETCWSTKLVSIGSVKPNVGDLIRVAQQDEDLTFRVFATLQLGYTKFERGEPANQEAIADAIAQAKESHEPLVREAALAAEAMTIDQFRQAFR